MSTPKRRNSSVKKSRNSVLSPVMSPRRLNATTPNSTLRSSISSSSSSSSPTLSKDQLTQKIHERLQKLKERTQSGDLTKRRTERFASPKKTKGEAHDLIATHLTPREKIDLAKEQARTENLQRRELREFYDQAEKRTKGTLELLQKHLDGDVLHTPSLSKEAKEGIMDQLRILEQRYGQRQFSPQRQRLMAKNEKYSNVQSRFASPPRQNDDTNGSSSARKASSTDAECTFSPATNKETNEKMGVKSKFKTPHKITNGDSPASEKDKVKLMDKELTFHPKINDNSKSKGQSRLWDYLEKQKQEREEQEQRKKSTTPKRRITPKKVSERIMNLSRPRSPPPPAAAEEDTSNATTPRTPRSARGTRSTSTKRKITPKRSVSAKRKGTRALSAKRTKTPMSPRDTATSPRVVKRTARDALSPSRQLSPSRTKSARRVLSPSRQFSPQRTLKSPRRTKSTRKAMSPSRELSPGRAMSPRVTSPKLSRKREITNFDHVPVGVFIHGSPHMSQINGNNAASNMLGADDEYPQSFSPHTLERVEKLRQQLEQQHKSAGQQIHKPGGFIELGSDV